MAGFSGSKTAKLPGGGFFDISPQHKGVTVKFRQGLF
jgi:hypothetical protein